MHAIIRPFLFLAALLLLAGCATSTPQSRIRDQRETFSRYPDEIQRKIKAGQVEVGFTGAMAEMALGKPGRKLRRQEQAGDDEEVWVYYRNEPRVSLGFGIGSGGYRSTSTGISMSTTPDPDQETKRLILRDDRVVAIETVVR